MGSAWGVLSLAAITHLSAAAAFAAAPGCTKDMRLSGREYWFYELAFGMEGVSQTPEVVTGKSLGPPPFDFCFEARRSEVEDGLNRTNGYIEAIGRLARDLTEEPKAWDTDSRSLEVRSKIEAVAGRKFKTPDDFGKWYGDRDFLHWSPTRGALLLDEQAKRERRRITELDVGELTSASYWSLEASGYISESSRDGEFLRGVYWDGFEDRRFRIPASTLTDRVAREAGYRKAARILTSQLERAKAPDPGWLEKKLKQCSSLTGRSFKTSEEWVQWCEVNCDRLRLSPDGLSLVPEK
jgi:hypothetical protein